MAYQKIAGVVLAGGRSSRMGQDKALLTYKGQPFVKHMVHLLQKTKIEDVYISSCKSYLSEQFLCLQDRTPYAGPAQAILDILFQLIDYKGILFVPVDMPFLTAELLHFLLTHEKGAYYEGFPLPVYIPKNITIDFFPNPTSAGNLSVGSVLESSCTLTYTPVLRSDPPSNSLPEVGLERSLIPKERPQAVHRLLTAMNISSIPIKQKNCFININTPDDWKNAYEFKNR